MQYLLRSVGDSSDKCKWLHEELSKLPEVSFPKLQARNLPDNGIYFFYEEGEVWGHGGNSPRIVRIGTHNDGNFRSRMMFDHYDMKNKRSSITRETTAPKDRSIFRKNIGRALLYDSDYLKIWNHDYTSDSERGAIAPTRNIESEKRIENQISELLENEFSFRFVELEGQSDRIGKRGIESKLIGTVSHCKLCTPSAKWLGRRSPIKKISGGKMWLVQHLDSRALNNEEVVSLSRYVTSTMAKWGSA